MTPIATSGEFPAATHEVWLEAVAEAIRGAKAIDQLARRTDDGIRVEPIVGRDRRPSPVAARNNPRSWVIRTLHTSSDARSVRSAIGDDLAAGVTSVALQLATPGQQGLPPKYEAIGAALKDVPLDRTGVCFSAGDQYFGIAQSLLALCEEAGMPSSAARGGIHADPVGTLARTGALEAGLWPSLEILGQFAASNLDTWPHVRLLMANAGIYHDAGASEAQELAAMLATTVEYLRVMDFEGVGAARLFAHLTVTLAADCDLFLTIAKLRAARLLLARLAAVCGAPGAERDLELWVTTSERMLTRRTLHTNILRNSIAGLGAAVGGADCITIRPHSAAVGVADAGAHRLARNIQLLLLEESGIARVLDPAAGSGHVAAVTEALAQRAWSLFQDIEAKGGIARMLLSGELQAVIAATAVNRQKEFLDGRRKLTGVGDPYEADEAVGWVAPIPISAPILHAQTQIPALPTRWLDEAPSA